MTESKSTTINRKEFQKRVWITTGIVALVVVLLWILKVVVNVLLLILAGALIALYFLSRLTFHFSRLTSHAPLAHLFYSLHYVRKNRPEKAKGQPAAAGGKDP